MRLIYETSVEEQEVKVGDKVHLDGGLVTITWITPPHKPSSTGKVTVEYGDGWTREYYSGVVGAKWIERDDL